MATSAVAGVDGVFEHESKAAQHGAVGVVRVAVPGSLGRRCVVDMLAPTVLANPGLVIDVRVSDQLTDVVEAKIDVGVRIGRMQDNRFVAKRAALLPLFVVAAPSLLRRVVEPDTVEDLQHLPLSALIDGNTGRPWPWVFKGRRQVQALSPAFVTDDPEAECAAVVAGLAFGQLASHLALPWIEQGRLRAVLEHLEPEPWPVVVYRPRRTPVPARVRWVFDALVAGLGEQRWLPTRR
jgi:DNA-binding transcriptional LysR family regulator